MVEPPADSGGKAMYSVTEAVYHAWLRKHGKPIQPVRQFAVNEAVRIYFEDYWLPCGGPTLATGVDLASQGASFSSGVARSRKRLLASIGAPDHVTVMNLSAERLGKAARW